MMDDNMDDRIVVEKIALQEAKELATQITDDNDEDFMPWGGAFVTAKERCNRGVKVVAAGSTGEC